MKFTKFILCVGLIAGQAAYAMEPTAEQGPLVKLPQEIKALVIVEVTQADSFDEAIKSLAALAVVNVEFNTLIQDYQISRAIIRYLMHTFQVSQIGFQYAVEGRLKLNKDAVENYFKQGNELISAIQDKQYTTMQSLLRTGADANYIQTTGEQPKLTPLHAAMQKQDVQAVQLLLEYGVQPTQEDLHAAYLSKNVPLIQLFKKAMAKK